MSQIIEKSATELVNKIKSGELSSQEVTQAFLNQIEKVNPLINAIVQKKQEETLLEARQIDRDKKLGKKLGKLAGLPITIKDFAEVKNYICTYGTEGYKNRIAPTSAFCIKKLQAEGAIILGLTNSPELANAYETSNVIYGTTNNPYDLGRSAGGSSGGEAAILAVNGSPLGLGSDGGGSIRLPAHFCGITGIKPTQGLISLDGISTPFAGVGLVYPHGTFGPMARYVEDLKLMLPILSGYNFKDPTSLPFDLQSFSSLDMPKLRIAVYTDNGVVTPDQSICSVLEKTADFLSNAGCIVDKVTIPALKDTFELFWKVYFRKGDQGQKAREILAKIGTKNISTLHKKFLEDSEKTSFGLIDLYNHIEEIAKFRAAMHEFMDNYDIILCPPCRTVANPHNTSFNNLEDYSYTMAYNLLGWPAGVVRCGQTPEGLPIGVQVVGKPWHDYLVIEVLQALENKFKGFQPACLFPHEEERKG